MPGMMGGVKLAIHTRLTHQPTNTTFEYSLTYRIASKENVYTAITCKRTQILKEKKVPIHTSD